ncbi:MAG: adenylate kinase [Rickettsiaceae bacterium]|nr:adenylate kinase [Rickettsiaceae bacterium]MDP4832305.1 adenylate kinase [Rickettsiaceae bacterium]MDP5020240.1 adenylate kinase [Rickettsiaceae bacterium]MDP5083075.1 adenylate kinase [Rickettsiaceae bacterium]
MIKKIILLLGLPGSGKGTQGAILSKELALPHISTGDIFRKMILEKSKESKMLAEYMDEGKLVPSDLVNKIVKQFILSDECREGCILDGYPRTLRQAEYFISNIDTKVSVIYLKIDDEVVVKRILGRISCASCGKLYNEYFDKPKKDGVCDECGATEFIARADDDEDTILARIEEYKKETLPLIEYYKHKGKFFTVNAGESKEQVVNELASIIKKI